MKVITLRNMPPKVAQLIETRSRETGLSLNKTVIRLLEELAGPGESSADGPPYTDLDHLFGIWSDEEADEFDKHLAEQRRIEPEMWE